MPEERAIGAALDITVPVLNEESCLEQSIATMVGYLAESCPYDWSVTVVDNGSEDATWAIAASLAATYDRVSALHLDQRGRGAALKASWARSSADVLAYTDVDLSTSLESLPALVDPIVSGRAEVSIGSRLAKGASVRRSLRREVISRTYNVITRAAFRYGVRDAQCGFKALSAQVAAKLLPEIVDDGWFFDTELLVKAKRYGFRVHEVPVAWVEDPDSRVRIVSTAVADLKGIWRVLREGQTVRGSHPGEPRQR